MKNYILNKVIVSVLLVTSSYADILIPKANSSREHKRIEEIMTKIFYDELFKISKDLKPEEEVKKAKFSINDGRRGKMIIEMLKQKNREKIARMRGLDPSKATSGEALVAAQREKNKEEIAAIRARELKLDQKYSHLPIMQRKKKIWQELAKRELMDLKSVVEKNKGWRKQHKETLYNWKKDYEKYVGKVDEYKEGVDTIPLVLPVSEDEQQKEVETVIIKDHFTVKSSLEIDIRDQGPRPTCSSFAGVRAIEILAAQNGKSFDLSEQYFYWASKPKCRQSPCSNRGSWVGYGLDYSKKGQLIPLESSCPYKRVSVAGNDTQIPLKESCQSGKVRVKDFSYIKTLDQVLAHIRNNQAVIASFKLTPNFYQNSGLILNKDKNKKGAMDKHSAGHAVLLIGYIKLPKVLNEGSVCFITANSWGSGWGHGGYACLSEKWVLSQRQGNPFVVINSVSI